VTAAGNGAVRRGRLQWLAGLAVALLGAGVLSFYAAGSPDGLEWVSKQLGFAHAATESAAAGSPFADYQLAGVPDERLSVGLAGVVGTLLVLAISMSLLRALRRRPGKTH
jgi:hypothetical protein